MPATTCSRLAVKPSTGAGTRGARHLSSAKLAPTHTGSGRESVISPDLQIGAKDLSLPSRETATALPGSGAALATRKAPVAAIATRNAAPVAICFNMSAQDLFGALRIDGTAPYHVLLQQRAQGHHALVYVFLHPLTAIGFGGVDVALGVRHNTVHGIELTGRPSAANEPVKRLRDLAVEDMDVLVGAVRDVQELLLRIAGGGDHPHQSVALGVGLDDILLEIRAIGLENLDAVVGAVADIDQPVIGRLGAMHRIAELR